MQAYYTETVDVSPIPKNLPKPETFNDGLLTFFPLVVALIGLSVREFITYQSESAKAKRDLEIEEEKLERAEREALIKDLREERKFLLEQFYTVQHQLECSNCDKCKFTGVKDAIQ